MPAATLPGTARPGTPVLAVSGGVRPAEGAGHLIGRRFGHKSLR